MIRDLTPDQLAPAALDRLRKLDPADFARRRRIAAHRAVRRQRAEARLHRPQLPRPRRTRPNSPIPKEPILFLKATSSINGPNDDVILPKASQKGDWEVELGIVIGTTARYVAEHDALKYVAGYCIVNDVSEREFQIERGGQWTKGKSCDTFCPLGPWLVTADEVPDPQALELPARSAAR